MAETLVGRGEDVSLTAGGLAQLPALTERLRQENVKAVYCSPRRRTRQTAQPIAMACGAPLVIESALDEVDFGEWTGRTFAELESDPAWQHWNVARSTAASPEGESMHAAQNRAVDAMRRLAERHDGQCVVIVSHAEIVRSLLLHALGLPLEAYVRLEIGPASRSVVDVGPWGTKVILMNEHTA